MILNFAGFGELCHYEENSTSKRSAEKRITHFYKVLHNFCRKQEGDNRDTDQVQ